MNTKFEISSLFRLFSPDIDFIVSQSRSRHRGKPFRSEEYWISNKGVVVDTYYIVEINQMAVTIIILYRGKLSALRKFNEIISTRIETRK
jgi:hypothetical protein